LFLTEFEGLGHPEKTVSFGNCVYLLERFNELRGYIELLDEEDDRGLCDMVALFFRTIRYVTSSLHVALSLSV